MKRRSNVLAGNLDPPSTKACKIEIDHGELPADFPCDAEAGLIYMKSLFPVGKFGRGVPVVVMKHQVYSIVHDKTTVDREMIELRDKRKIRFFKLGLPGNDIAVVFTEDYVGFVKQVMGDTPLCRKFVHAVLPECVDVSVSKQQLSGLHLTKEEMIAIVNFGVLVMRDVGSWWFGIPGISSFVRSFTKGRNLVLQAIRRSKFREVLQKDLLGRCWTGCSLGVEYHIHDLIGAELVQCIETTSGPLLRLVEDVKTK